MPRRLSFAIAALLPLLASVANAETQPRFAPTPGTGTFTTITGVEYARVGNTSLKADLRIPDNPGPHPVILWLHTGAWVTGDRTGGPAIRQASRGYAVVSIDYRLAPQYTFPAQIDDVKAAVRWIRANAAQYHFDPNRVGVFGGSAGGHLAALLGTSGGVSELEDLSMGNPQYSSRVQVVVDFYGPTDLLKMQDQNPGCYPVDANDPLLPPSLLLGCAVQSCPDKAATANPMTYISSDDPPFLILQGTADCLVPWQQSQMLHEALRAKGLNSTLYLLQGAEHGGAEFDDIYYKRIVSDFLDRYLKQRPDRKRAVSR